MALIVGPAGSATSAYRRLADEAAAAASAAGGEVVKVYSPDATWPAVRKATRGASIVVYLGHGNGWPSRYRDALYPPTQNGFGLNPVADGDDSTHQYFGERSVERLALADNAVVVLSHLCYASGNTEPGVPEDTSDEAVQRVDNYAAGFLRAGARAVIADAQLGPAYYVRALLRERGSVESIWNGAPTASGRHTIAAASVRTPGYALLLDPRRATGGYTRSLVAQGLTAAQLRSGARGVRGASVTTAVVIPSLATLGLAFAEPRLRALPVVGTTTRVTLPLAAGRASAIPAGARISVRWDAIALDAPVGPAAGPAVDPAAGDPAVDPAAPATPSPDPTPPPLEPAPEVDLVVPERLGSVVEPVRAARGAKAIGVDVVYPSVPGLYRLTAILHTPGGVAYDAATQELLTPVIVRVAGPVSAAYGVPAALSIEAGTRASVAVQVLNAGSQRWDPVLAAAPQPSLAPPGASAAGADPDGPDATPGPTPTPGPAGAAFVLPSLVASWVSADGNPVPAPAAVTLPGDAWAAGGRADLALDLAAPETPGSYLLLLDVRTPEHGALSALGTAPALIRVTVQAATDADPAPTARPAPGASPVPDVEPASPSAPAATGSQPGPFPVASPLAGQT